MDRAFSESKDSGSTAPRSDPTSTTSPTSADLVYGGSGNDCCGPQFLLQGGAGPDEIRGGRGRDELVDWEAQYDPGPPGPDDRDLLVGGSGSDEIAAGKGPDHVRGDRGDDRIYVREGADRVFAGRDDDRIITDDDDAVDVIRCGPGRDVVTYQGQIDPLDVRTGANACGFPADAVVGTRPGPRGREGARTAVSPSGLPRPPLSGCR